MEMMIHEARFRPSEHKLLCALMTNDALLASTLYQGEINEKFGLDLGNYLFILS
jgi:hypothetical protein